MSHDANPDLTTTNATADVPAEAATPADVTPTEPAKPTFVQPIVALPDTRFFWKRMIIVVVVIGVALWFFRDGFSKYPAHNRKVAELEEKRKVVEASKDEAAIADLSKQIRDAGTAHNSLNMAFQKVAGFPLMALGIFLLVKFLRESRGELRLENDVLHAPRHPPVPIRSITGLDNARWDKKGIALFDYRLDDGTAGRIKIDDFIFARPPTDAIHDELLAKMPKAAETVA